MLYSDEEELHCLLEDGGGECKEKTTSQEIQQGNNTEYADTDHDGLNSTQARHQRDLYGRNIIPAPTALPPWLCCLIPCLKQSKASRYFDICVPEDCSVRRNGTWVHMDAIGVVIGDLVRLQAGDRAAADLRIVQVSAGTCIFDNFAITGRNEKITYLSNSTEIVPKHPNIVHTGVLCVEGGCIGKVIATGADTVIGKMILSRNWPA